MIVARHFAHDGGRTVSVHVPDAPVRAVVHSGDGQLIAGWGAELDVDVLVVGVHRATDETTRLHEYSPGFDPVRFAAHEQFLLEDVRNWVESEFGIAPAARATAIAGVSAGGELALALGLRHPDVFGAVLCASPGAGFAPPQPLPQPLPRTYLVAGRQEPFFRANAQRWAAALQAAGAPVVLTERDGEHGGPFWRREFPLMVRWAFGDAISG